MIRQRVEQVSQYNAIVITSLLIANSLCLLQQSSYMLQSMTHRTVLRCVQFQYTRSGTDLMPTVSQTIACIRVCELCHGP